MEFGGDERRKAEEAWLLALAMLLANVHGEMGSRNHGSMYGVAMTSEARRGEAKSKFSAVFNV